MPSVVIRIALRYLAAMLVAKGLLLPGDADMLANDAELLAAVEVGIGLALAGVVEAWYWSARRFGWGT